MTEYQGYAEEVPMDNEAQLVDGYCYCHTLVGSDGRTLATAYSKVAAHPFSAHSGVHSGMAIATEKISQSATKPEEHNTLAAFLREYRLVMGDDTPEIRDAMLALEAKPDAGEPAAPDPRKPQSNSIAAKSGGQVFNSPPTALSTVSDDDVERAALVQELRTLSLDTNADVADDKARLRYIRALGQAAAALSTTDAVDMRERAVEAVAGSKLPKERWACSDDESGTALTLSRQRRASMEAIRSLPLTQGDGW
ncbi:hypothetical protein HME9302_00938 [Alteripontixanthobacter maritimus]|uniref:Uncharacterized protein n=1 Tax=Alteripontixanthobacter maritimus TaxID=2161824 RepID=A0A369Q4C8_9SPHN|nr:hypothetical protein [Alteripontixanthobacter maritimus]RDC59743.1 hypothetical protein HME9302_00938 [Alteripontixanthobacter maritimus]